ncbi:GNAT family N-acetyltransferase [Rheinheimera sp.]|uniref:GNAT family N-acetyltransferase n=1 Tax=Rheinheimera sp. TaxID=1869214 RepID=UPI00261246D5|nr:GNAT family N-acetyltransferase [Rheinheimera sp.]MCA1928423.1 GNAT family N-acetyltransferase [Rheinheimera sp.]
MLSYQIESSFDLEEMLILYKRSGINRPIDNKNRMATMLASANLLVTARQEGHLVGLARCMTDKAWVVYICDLLVDQQLQHNGIGKELLRQVQLLTGPEVQQLLHSAESAMTYYPKVGYQLCHNAFVVKREH